MRSVNVSASSLRQRLLRLRQRLLLLLRLKPLLPLRLRVARHPPRRLPSEARPWLASRQNRSSLRERCCTYPAECYVECCDKVQNAGCESKACEKLS